MTGEPEDAIWEFATDFYARPGVAPACLALQEMANLDVVHLILLLYADIALSQPLAVDELPALRHEMANWRGAAVLPLRAVRQRLKGDEPGLPREKEALRSEVKQAWLLAERMQLAIGGDWLRGRQRKPGMRLEEALPALLRLYGDAVIDNGCCAAALPVINAAVCAMRADGSIGR